MSHVLNSMLVPESLWNNLNLMSFAKFKGVVMWGYEGDSRGMSIHHASHGDFGIHLACWNSPAKSYNICLDEWMHVEKIDHFNCLFLQKKHSADVGEKKSWQTQIKNTTKTIEFAICEDRGSHDIAGYNPEVLSILFRSSKADIFRSPTKAICECKAEVSSESQGIKSLDYFFVESCEGETHWIQQICIWKR